MNSPSLPIPRRSLGSSGLPTTVVGLGSWAMGGPGAEGYGPQDDDDSIRAIRRAISAGVGWIDTAPIYGLGHAEEVVGRALRDVPPGDRPMVFTKCGLLPDSDRPGGPPKRMATPATMRVELEASLRRLGIERIDLYQLHRPDEAGTPVEDTWGEMGRFIEEGKVGAAGVSNFTVAQLEQYEQVRHIDSLQPPFSLVRRAAADVIDWARRNGTGVIVYSPMQGGLLTDAFTVERAGTFADSDWRRTDPDFAGERLRRNIALRDALVPIARKLSASTATIAIAWVLSWPGVTGAIVGARRPDQVESWLAAASVVLDVDDLQRISEVIQRTGAGSGPTRWRDM